MAGVWGHFPLKSTSFIALQQAFLRNVYSDLIAQPIDTGDAFIDQAINKSSFNVLCGCGFIERTYFCYTGSIRSIGLGAVKGALQEFLNFSSY